MQLDICKVAGFCVFLVGFLAYGMQTVCLLVLTREKNSLVEGYEAHAHAVPKNESIHTDGLSIFDKGVCYNVSFLNVYLSAIVCISLFLAIHYRIMRVISKLIATGWIIECIYTFFIQTVCMIGLASKLTKEDAGLEKGMYILGEVCKEPIIYHVHLFVATFILMAMFYKFTILRSGAKKMEDI